LQLLSGGEGMGLKFLLRNVPVSTASRDSLLSFKHLYFFFFGKKFFQSFARIGKDVFTPFVSSGEQI
jgi:hypothetical protein